MITHYYQVTGAQEPDHAGPAKTGKAVGDRPPAPMASHEKMRIRAAAFRATQLYPGPVGTLISRELLDWENFGYILGGSSLIAALVQHVLTADLP